MHFLFISRVLLTQNISYFTFSVYKHLRVKLKYRTCLSFTSASDWLPNYSVGGLVRPCLKFRFKMSREQLSLFSRWMWKQSPGVKHTSLCRTKVKHPRKAAISDTYFEMEGALKQKQCAQRRWNSCRVGFLFSLGSSLWVTLLTVVVDSVLL